MAANITEVTENYLQPIVEELQLELVDVEFVKEGKNWFLRVYVDKTEGIDIEECAVVSEKLSAILDENDPVDFPYFLEVSSPGAERPLKTKQAITKNIGKNVYVKLYEPIDNEKEYEGTLKAFEDDVLTLEVMVKARKKEVALPYEKIAKARLAVTFN
ncbi:ribosome maturation factor RimP [Terribacillus sp. DMT04]|uniref:ribosome maturation factor RimP n=1 Tax=Terribacillus sp. DMT04 TaxID=2850441 RepID=UPI001C2C3257|nr:ribosome maturation factor RimP [Terribacillus sp. DMT04]QXE03131.1 ribosome maturation factor RimP [Terribacillus sp. DMT04]